MENNKSKKEDFDMYTYHKEMEKEEFQLLMANSMIRENAICSFNEKAGLASATIFDGDERTSKMLERRGFN